MSTTTPSKKTLKQAFFAKIAAQNPDLTPEFIKGILKARQEARAGKLLPYIFSPKKSY